MVKYILLLLLLPSVGFAEIKLTAPESCVVGELVRLDATASDSETLEWRIVPDSPDFQPVGKTAFFSSRQGGDFLIIVAGSEQDKPVLHTHFIHVDGGTMSIGDLDTIVKELLKKVVTKNGREEAIKLAQSFRAIGGTEIPVEQILTATVAANRAALGESLEAWKPFLDGLAQYLDALTLENKLNVKDDYTKTWVAIANAIERHVK